MPRRTGISRSIHEGGSFSLIRRSKEYVINIPTCDLSDTVIGVGNAHGDKGGKFEEVCGIEGCRYFPGDVPNADTDATMDTKARSA